jgi:putative ABC transport system substrate-binding protein
MRREFVTLLGGAAGMWPLIARAAGSRPRIAVLSINSAQDDGRNMAAFIEGLHALGHVTGQNVDIDYSRFRQALQHGFLVLRAGNGNG